MYILEVPLTNHYTPYKCHVVGSALHRPCTAKLPSVLQHAMACVNMCLVVTVAALLMPETWQHNIPIYLQSATEA